MKNTKKIIASALFVAPCSVAGVSSIFASSGDIMGGIGGHSGGGGGSYSGMTSTGVIGGGGGGFVSPIDATPNTGAIIGTGKTAQYYISKDKASIGLYKGTNSKIESIKKQISLQIKTLTNSINKNNSDTKLTQNQKLSINARLDFIKTKLESINSALVEYIVVPSLLSITRTDGLGNPTLPAGSKGNTVYSARFSSTQGNAILLSNLSATFAGTSAFAGNTDLDLYVNGVWTSSKTILAGTSSVSFNDFRGVVTTSKFVDITIKANFSDVVSAGTFQVASVSYDAIGNPEQYSITKPTVAGATFTIN